MSSAPWACRRPRTDDGVHKLTRHGQPALDLETQAEEEVRRRVEIRNRDADVVEGPDTWHVLQRSCVVAYRSSADVLHGHAPSAITVPVPDEDPSHVNHLPIRWVAAGPGRLGPDGGQVFVARSPQRTDRDIG